MSVFSTSVSPVTVESGGLVYPAWTVEALRAAGVNEGDILVGVRRALHEAIDVEAERLRARVMTPGAGQALEYKEVLTQAQAVDKAKSTATAERYPMLAATIGIDIDPQTGQLATDVLGVSRCVLAMGEAWSAFATTIRRVRLSGKAAVRAAVTLEEAQAAFAGIEWPALPS